MIKKWDSGSLTFDAEFLAEISLDILDGFASISFKKRFHL